MEEAAGTRVLVGKGLLLLLLLLLLLSDESRPKYGTVDEDAQAACPLPDELWKKALAWRAKGFARQGFLSARS